MEAGDPWTLLSRLLRQHRGDRDLTIEALAFRSGVSERTIGDIERGVSTGPQRRTVIALADGLSLDGGAREVFLAAARPGRRSAPDRDRDDAHRPHWLEDFTGREAEVAQLLDLLRPDVDADRACAPIVISGPPGAGKTSLAIEAVRRLRSGRTELFIDAAGTARTPLTPLRILQALLRQLRPDGDVPRTVAAASAQWREVTTEEPVVVIVDDAALESQVRPLLGFDGRSRLIATSRRTLGGVEGARHIAVGPMSRADSVAFLERALAATQRGDADLEELAELCADLPLALRVAVGRIGAHGARSAGDFIRRLRAQDRRLDLLVAGDLGVIRAFMASCEFLSAPARSLFQYLGLVHGSSFDAALAAAVGGLEVDDARDLLDGLVDLGLVEALEGERFRLHDLLRLFAERELRAHVSEEQIEERRRMLRAWLLATTRAAAVMLTDEDTGAGTADESNAGARFADAADAERWLTMEADRWYEALVETAAAGGHHEVLATAAVLPRLEEIWTGWGRWREVFALAAATADAVGDQHRRAKDLTYVAYAELYERFDAARAVEAAHEAIAVALASGNDDARAWALAYLAQSERNLERMADAEAHARESAEVFASLGDVRGGLEAGYTLATVLMTHDAAAAAEEFAHLRAVAEDPDGELLSAERETVREQALSGLARSLIMLGRFADALEISWLLDAHVGNNAAGRARAHRHLGFARIGLGQRDEARADLEAALRFAGSARPDAWAAEIEAALREL
ncbi:AAA family ATPase [Microbacterium sp. 1P10UB]|uniref:AAA family ATPase n=1 Tax=unclassified Microbacterium TaxID=2609290 RepID=UPI0039A221D8